jgi:hypothetical protein
VGKPEGKRPLGRPRRRWEDNIRIDIREIRWGGMDWIDLNCKAEGVRRDSVVLGCKVQYIRLSIQYPVYGHLTRDSILDPTIYISALKFVTISLVVYAMFL